MVCLAAIGAFASGPFWRFLPKCLQKNGRIGRGIHQWHRQPGRIFRSAPGRVSEQAHRNFSLGFAMLGAFMLIGAALTFGLTPGRKWRRRERSRNKRSAHFPRRRCQGKMENTTRAGVGSAGVSPAVLFPALRKSPARRRRHNTCRPISVNKK